MAVRPVPHRFTVEDYYRMAESGILGEDDRVELLEGEIIEMAPIGSRHAACVNRLNRLLSPLVGDEVVVAVQNPLRLESHTEVQPDVALLRARDDFYAASHPEPRDVLLVIEVVETSMTYDRSVKLALYARAGITEVWVVDLSAVRIETCCGPSPQGYEEVARVDSGDRLAVTHRRLELEASAVLGK